MLPKRFFYSDFWYYLSVKDVSSRHLAKYINNLAKKVSVDKLNFLYLRIR